MVMLHEKNDGDRKQVAVNAKLALEFYIPETRGRFQIAARSLQGWNRDEPVPPRGVCPKRVACGLARSLMLEGDSDARNGILLAYDCYLRPAELCAICLEDVTFQEKEGVEMCNALILPKTKRGINRSVLVRPIFLQILVAWLLRRQMAAAERTTQGQRREFHFNFNGRGLRKLLHEATERLNIQHLGITPRAF